jgi:hypothetical protein
MAGAFLFASIPDGNGMDDFLFLKICMAEMIDSIAWVSLLNIFLYGS